MIHGQMARLPGMGTSRAAAFRSILTSRDMLQFLPGGVTVDASQSRDPGNTGYVSTLRAGMLLGKRTANGQYAPSIIGSLGDAVLGTGTQMNLLTDAMATELVRRVGATGTFTLLGPSIANGRVRSRTITYSAVGSGAGTNEVQTFTPDAAATAGTYRIKLQKPDGTAVYTAAIAFNATLAACQAAITLALGAVAGWVASTAGSAAPFSAGPIALVLTASGTGYTAHDYPMCEVEITSLTGVTTMTSVETTRGASVAASVTVTAPGLALAGDVQILTANAAMTAGTLTFGIPDANDVYQWIRATWDTNIATTVAAWNVLADARLGTGYVVLTSNATVWTFTFGTAVAHGMREHPEVLMDITGVTGPATYVFSRLGGHSEGFAAGSLVMPTDGSQTPLGILGKEDGLKVTDQDGNDVDMQLDELVIGGQLDASQIVSWPTDTGLIAWIKSKLRAVGLHYTFDDDF